MFPKEKLRQPQFFCPKRKKMSESRASKTKQIACKAYEEKQQEIKKWKIRIF